MKNNYLAKGQLISAVNQIMQSHGIEPTEMEGLLYSVLCDLKDQITINMSLELNKRDAGEETQDE